MRAIKYISTIFMFFLLSGVLMGQELTILAYEAFQAKDYEKAKELINQSVESEDGKNDAQTWMLRAFIYKSLESDQNPDEEIRSEAIHSHEKSIELDTEKKFYDQNRKGIKYLIERYFNQAAILVQKGITDGSEELFEKYKTMTKKYFDTDFTERDKEFYKALGSVYNNKANEYEALSEKNLYYLGEAVKRFEIVLELDSLEYTSNYNIGSIYYNQGVEIIQSSDPTLSIEEFPERFNRATSLFFKALPYIEIAHRITPERAEPIIALRWIHHGLYNFEESEKFEKMLESIENK